MKRAALALALLSALSTASCEKDHDAALPAPREITDSSTAQFCGMALNEHSGPKAQIFVDGLPDPYWFASVRDAFAYLFLPETPKAVVAVYVNDMAKAKSWDHPEAGSWIDAHSAVFVIGSRRHGGMSADEAIPFGSKTAASAFVSAEGGRIVQFADMPQDYVLGANTGEK
ncbi:nitrous oxide reductase accessory protein NosL [Rhodoblastus sp.]|uniref:nitrous oxide reductase accessory protein NosL n=1 Tax=Rhodoblastus sp. TaxID=1962975 RepID=UPI0026348BA2|nr:nitrous oxide reductase accessory protein NosL [Rhodoblastus sp.]